MLKTLALPRRAALRRWSLQHNVAICFDEYDAGRPDVMFVIQRVLESSGRLTHGGRQLGGAPSSISVLPAIADAVGSSIEILFDGGIRSGQDLMRAIARGARACLSGRAYLYGLGAGGQAGVARAIEILRNELDVSMALTGITSVADIDRRVIAGI
jgi:hypothetical protein